MSDFVLPSPLLTYYLGHVDGARYSKVCAKSFVLPMLPHRNDILKLAHQRERTSRLAAS